MTSNRSPIMNNDSGPKTPRSTGPFGRSSLAGGQSGINDLAHAAREQMNSFFGRSNAQRPSHSGDNIKKSAVDAAIAESTAATAADGNGGDCNTISPSNSLSEALQLNDDTSLTFTSPSEVPVVSSPHSATRARGAVVLPPATGNPAREPAVVTEAKPAAAAAPDVEGADVAAGPAVCVEATEESPRSMVAALRQLLSEDARVSQVWAEQREAVRKRTSAGLLWVDGLSSASLLAVATVAVVAVFWSRGGTLAAGMLWLLWEHGSDLVAALCVLLLLVKAALAADVDRRIRSFLAGLDEMQASVRAVQSMQADVHRMRSIIETMQGDLEAKTAWIPKGITPPAWLPGQKR